MGHARFRVRINQIKSNQIMTTVLELGLPTGHVVGDVSSHMPIHLLCTRPVKWHGLP
jgi:hypothetical protein